MSHEREWTPYERDLYFENISLRAELETAKRERDNALSDNRDWQAQAMGMAKVADRHRDHERQLDRDLKSSRAGLEAANKKVALLLSEGVKLARKFEDACRNERKLSIEFESARARIAGLEDALRAQVTSLEEELEVTESPGTRQSLECRLGFCRRALGPAPTEKPSEATEGEQCEHGLPYDYSCGQCRDFDV